MSKTFHTRELSPFGLEVLDVDLTADHDAQAIDELRHLWVDNGVLLFRGQQLEEADIVRFSARFGRLEIHVREEYLSKAHPEVLIVSNIQQDGKALGILADHEVGWHHDQIYLSKPALGSLLYSVELPASGGNTEFANLADAYAALPDAKKQRLEGLRAVQSYAHFNGQWSEPTNDRQTQRTPDVTHPLVRRHPESGVKSIYADPGMTAMIENRSRDESRALLDELFAWCTQDRFIYEHRWCLGDALMWDNASTMHRRGAFDSRSRRLMKRTTILPPDDRAVPV